MLVEADAESTVSICEIRPAKCCKNLPYISIKKHYLNRATMRNKDPLSNGFVLDASK